MQNRERLNRDDEFAFTELMAEELRRTPWLGLSLLIHALVLLTLWMWPVEETEPDRRVMAVAPPEEPVQLDDVEPPPEDPVPQEPVDEPVLQENVVTESTDVNSEAFDDFAESTSNESAFTSDAWNQAVGLTGGAGGLEGGGRIGRKPRSGIGRQTAETIRNALEWLAAHQDADGRWDADEFMKHDPTGDVCDGAGNPVHDVGVTGLALLAFLGDGHTLRVGEYRDVLKRGVKWLRSQQGPSGLIGSRNSNEFIYNHAIATLALVEAFGLSDYRLLRKSAVDAIGYLERHRNHYGVWRYDPGAEKGDTSVTGWCVLAYKSARDFGIPVNQAALTQSLEFFDAMTDPLSGRCGYLERGGQSSRRRGDHEVRFPRDRNECMTSVSMLCRVLLGRLEEERELFAKQTALVLERLPRWEAGAVDQYAWYYASYALYQMGGSAWKKWSRALTPAVVRTQRADGSAKGSWDPAGVWGEDGGRVYSTAILCLTLEAYYRYSRVIGR